MASENEKKAAADRDLAIKKALFKTEINASEAKAAVAFDIEKAKQGQVVSGTNGQRTLYRGRDARADRLFCTENQASVLRRQRSRVVLSTSEMGTANDARFGRRLATVRLALRNGSVSCPPDSAFAS